VPRYDLDGRAILVTGGGTGIGRAAALTCAASGGRIVVSGLHEGPLRDVAAEIRDSGGEAAACVMDAADSGSVAAAVAFTVRTFGALHGAFNAAGISGPMMTRLLDLTEAEFDAIIATNLKGVWLSMKHQIAQMMQQGGGSIVNASSVAGLVGTRVNTGYSASKFGVTGMTRSVAQEYGAKGIRVNAICPGWIISPMTEAAEAAHPGLHAKQIARHPIGRAGTPDDVSDIVAWLLSDAARFVTGTAIPVDGGLRA
jgi:NAD(P)-dependent dehydrogenase (short-subunit alcohol dehydrogenase family)